MVLVDSARGLGPDQPHFTTRRDAASAHPRSERAAPVPVRARLLLPRRGLHSDGKRRALWTLPRGLHWQWLALCRRQRGAPVSHTTDHPPNAGPYKLPTSATISSPAGSAHPEDLFTSGDARPDDPLDAGGHSPRPLPLPPVTPVAPTPSVASEARPDHSSTAESGPPQRSPSPPGFATPNDPSTTARSPPGRPSRRRAPTPRRPLPPSAGDAHPHNTLPRP